MGDGRSSSGGRRDLLVLAVVAIVVRLPAVLSSRHLSFDDGVYGATAVALRDGARPYRDVFSSQGPLHQPMLFVADLLGARTANAPRLLALAAGVVITLATYLAARAVADRRAALVAAVLATTSGSVLLVTTGISGDGPSIAFAVSAVAVALSARTHPGLGRVVAAGLLVGAACAVKLLAAPVVIPVGLCLLARRQPRQLVAAAVAAVAVPLLAAAPWGYGRVWDQSVAYHQEARRYTVVEVVGRIFSTLVQRDAFVFVTVVVAVIVAVLARREWQVNARPVLARPGVWFGAWLAVLVVMLLAESGMWRPHVSQLIVPLCLLATLRLPGWKVLVVAWLVAAPIWIVSVNGIVRPGGYRGSDAEVAAWLRALPDGTVIVTDEPGFAWRTGNRVPDAFVDASVKQFDHDLITEREVLHEARRQRACAVLITADDRLGRWPELQDRLEPDGYRVVFRDGETRLLLRPCKRAD